MESKKYRVCLLLVSLTSVLQVSLGQGAVCRHECIKLRDCPSLARLLSNPSPTDLKTLQEATCFVEATGLETLVCCEDAAPTPPQPTQPQPPPLNPAEPLSRSTSCGVTFPNAIVGGLEASFESEIWLALLGYRDPSSEEIQFLCAGSLVNERYLITAAHCINPALLKPKELQLEVIRVGEKDLLSDTNCNNVGGTPRCFPPSQDFAPEEVIQHPGYNSKSFANDIALIRQLAGRYD
ncbi:serine protease easter-like [Penaeus japonicus]|uniref:serine protease easter-like n=1 Tax=Penaeus japonicus TaxID=27405 RepID=UPI001C70FD55|nr:serine protease easter-like [Penaeus japonicus]